MNTAIMRVLVIYHNPVDHPGRYVTRAQWIYPGRVEPDPEPLAVVDTLEEARAVIPPDMDRVARDPHDEPQVVECWL